MNFSKKSHFLKNVSRFRGRYKKTMRLTQCIAKWKMRNTEANIKYFAFVNYFDLFFSQIKIITKFLKNFIKEGLNFSQMALFERFSYRKCEILWLLLVASLCYAKHKHR